jgi:hypothetical protein
MPAHWINNILKAMINNNNKNNNNKNNNNNKPTKKIDVDDIKLVWHCSLKYASRAGKDNKSNVLKAVRRNGYNLEYASDRLRDDVEVVWEALKDCPMAIQYASERLQRDRNFFMHVIKEIDGTAFCMASPEFKDDREMALAAMANSRWITISDMSDRLRDDYELVMRSVKIYGHKYTYASDRLKQDRTITMLAVARSPLVFLKLPKHVQKHDKKVVVAASRHFSFAYSWASSEVQDDRSVALKVVKYDGDLLRNASTRLRDDLDVVLAAIRSTKRPCRFQDISERLRADPYIQNLHRWRWSLGNRLVRWIVDRHRDLQASKVAAQADLWLIRHEGGNDPYIGISSSTADDDDDVAATTADDDDDVAMPEGSSGGQEEEVEGNDCEDDGALVPGRKKQKCFPGRSEDWSDDSDSDDSDDDGEMQPARKKLKK